MFDFFKNKEKLLAEKLLKLQSKDNEALKDNVTFIKSIAVLTTNEVNQKINIEALLQRSLNVENINIYSFRKFNKEQEISKGFFSDKDINRKTGIVNSDFKAFLNTDFDLLIHFFDENNLYLEIASAISKASCKVGFSGVNSELLDLEITSDLNNLEAFLSELKKYLVILNKLPNKENLTV